MKLADVEIANSEIMRPRPNVTSGLVRYLEVAFILTLPIVLFFAYRVSPINQIGFLDPWLYTGHIHNFEDLVSRYGLPYYAVRFGLIVPHFVAAKLLGPIIGYLAVVYGMYLLAGIPLYLVFRKHISTASAVLAYSVFATSLWVARSLLWTHPDAAAVPYMIAAASILFLQPQRFRRTLFALLGMLVALAANCNVFTITISGLLIVPYFVLNQGRSYKAMLRDLGWATAGFASVFAIGAIGYYWCCGTADFLRPSLAMVLWSMKGGSLVYKAPIEVVLANAYVYAPLFILAAAYTARRYVHGSSRVLLSDAFLAYLIASSLFVVVWQFALNGVILELFYYFCFLIPPTIFCMAFVPSAFLETLSDRQRTIGYCAVLATLFSVPAVHSYGIFDMWRLPLVTSSTISLLALSALWLVGNSSKRFLVFAAAFFLVALGLQWQAVPSRFDPHFYTLIGRQASERFNDYKIGLAFMKAMPKIMEDGTNILFWYRNDSPLLNSIQSTYLWGYSRLTKPGDKAEGFPVLSDAEAVRLTSEAPVWLAILTENKDGLSKGMASLEAKGVEYEIAKESSFCEPPHCLHATLLQIRPRLQRSIAAKRKLGEEVALFRGGMNDWQQNAYSTKFHVLRRLAKLSGGFIEPPSLLRRDQNMPILSVSSPTDHVATPFVEIIPAQRGGMTLFSLAAEFGERRSKLKCRATVQDQQYNVLFRTHCNRLWEADNPHAEHIELAEPLPEKIRVVLDVPGGELSGIPEHLAIKQFVSITTPKADF